MIRLPRLGVEVERLAGGGAPQRSQVEDQDRSAQFVAEDSGRRPGVSPRGGIPPGPGPEDRTDQIERQRAQRLAQIERVAVAGNGSRQLGQRLAPGRHPARESEDLAQQRAGLVDLATRQTPQQSRARQRPEPRGAALVPSNLSGRRLEERGPVLFAAQTRLLAIEPRAGQGQHRLLDPFTDAGMTQGVIQLVQADGDRRAARRGAAQQAGQGAPLLRLGLRQRHDAADAPAQLQPPPEPLHEPPQLGPAEGLVQPFAIHQTSEAPSSPGSAV